MISHQDVGPEGLSDYETCFLEDCWTVPGFGMNSRLWANDMNYIEYPDEDYRAIHTKKYRIRNT